VDSKPITRREKKRKTTESKNDHDEIEPYKSEQKTWRSIETQTPEVKYDIEDSNVSVMTLSSDSVNCQVNEDNLRGYTQLIADNTLNFNVNLNKWSKDLSTIGKFKEIIISQKIKIDQLEDDNKQNLVKLDELSSEIKCMSDQNDENKRNLMELENKYLMAVENIQSLNAIIITNRQLIQRLRDNINEQMDVKSRMVNNDETIRSINMMESIDNNDHNYDNPHNVVTSSEETELMRSFFRYVGAQGVSSANASVDTRNIDVDSDIDGYDSDEYVDDIDSD
jgi:hypothetical protein